MRLLVILLMTLVSWTANAAELKSFEDIEQLFKGPLAPRTLESFLQITSQRNPSLYSGFTLMRESKSLQGSSPDSPRAIVFGSNARLVITFNGKPNQQGYNNIEMLQFIQTDHNTGFFQLREIKFSHDGAAPAVLSEINPPTCTRCHGTAPKPLWDEYDNWPGAYGEDDDALIDFDDGDKYPPSGYHDTELVKRHRQHLREFREFRKTTESHPRYKFLKFPEGTDSPVAPYIPRTRSGEDPLRPNLRLTKLFSELNAKKIARDLIARGDQCTKESAPMALAFLLSCENFGDNKSKLATTSSFLNEHLKSNRPPNALTPAVFSYRNPGMYQNGIVHLLQMMGFSDFEWTPARLTRQWQYFQGFMDASDSIASEIWPELQRLGLDLPSYDAILTERYPDYYRTSYSSSSDQPNENSYERERSPSYNAWATACNLLVENSSHVSPDSIQKSCLPKTNDTNIPKAISMCMSCHNGSTPAPALPLDSASKVHETTGLKDLIFKRINAEDQSNRMPPDRPLTRDEYNSITQFFGLK